MRCHLIGFLLFYFVNAEGIGFDGLPAGALGVAIMAPNQELEKAMGFSGKSSQILYVAIVQANASEGAEDGGILLFCIQQQIKIRQVGILQIQHIAFL